VPASHDPNLGAKLWGLRKEICGDDYRHTFRGDGAGAVTYQAKGVPVTFKRSRGGFWQTNEFALSGRLGRNAGYEVGSPRTRWASRAA
jgi:hypothetical protein